MSEKIFLRSVPVKLTQEEYVAMGKEMGRTQNEMKSLQDRLKEVSSDFKANSSQKEAMLNSLSITISNGYEYRDVDCVHVFRPKDGKKDIVRLDTQEIIGTEAMTKQDFQEILPLEPETNGDEVIDAICIEDKTDTGGLDDPKVYKLNAAENRGELSE
ncbi:MAG: hypothetical protein WC838_04925 [Candidatus Margulisiibacteriota bacterium]|jgi:hypothetical protein